MDLISQIVERAKSNKQRIVLPEGTEERTLKAANQVLTDGVADLILLGNPSEIMDLVICNGKFHSSFFGFLNCHWNSQIIWFHSKKTCNNRTVRTMPFPRSGK